LQRLRFLRQHGETVGFSDFQGRRIPGLPETTGDRGFLPKEQTPGRAENTRGFWLVWQNLGRLVISLSENEWRRERDSNPRCPLRQSGFQDRLFQPLTHPSAWLVKSRIAGGPTLSSSCALRLRSPEGCQKAGVPDYPTHRDGAVMNWVVRILFARSQVRSGLPFTALLPLPHL
jgi:hypothetical protein